MTMQADNDTAPQSIIDNIDEALGIKATHHAPGVTLFTRDGSQMGNAIIIAEVQPFNASLTLYLKKTDQKMWLIETDFGNRCKLSTNELNELFKLGRQQNYDKWFDDRLATIEKVVKDG
jgi:hypothetical protein